MLDEVQTGLGRTGRWLGFQHAGILPDVVTVAKALGNGVPVGACWARADVADAFQPGDHGSTFGGQPLACVGGAGDARGDGGRGRSAVGRDRRGATWPPPSTPCPGWPPCAGRPAPRRRAGARPAGRPRRRQGVQDRCSTTAGRQRRHRHRAPAGARPCSCPTAEIDEAVAILGDACSAGGRHRRAGDVTRHLLDIDDLTAAELSRRPRARQRPVPPRVLAGRGVGARLREAQRPHPQRHRDGGRPAGRPPGHDPGRGGRHRHPRRRSRTWRAPSPATTPPSAPVCWTTATSSGWPRVADVPVVNLLSDRAHPSQALADLLTIQQCTAGSPGCSVAYVGDWQQRRPLARRRPRPGRGRRCASPPRRATAVDDDLDASARSAATIAEWAPPEEAVEGADVVYTDVWASMGQEAEADATARRLRRLYGRRPRSWPWPSRCGVPALPARPSRRGGHAAVLDGPASRVWPQAENRMHAARGPAAAGCSGRGRNADDGWPRPSASTASARSLERADGDEPGPAGRAARRRRLVATQATVSAATSRSSAR